MSKEDNFNLKKEFESDLKVCFYYNTLVLTCEEPRLGELNNGLRKVEDQRNYIIEQFSSQHPLIAEEKNKIDSLWNNRYQSPFESEDLYFYEFLHMFFKIEYSFKIANSSSLPFTLKKIQCENSKLLFELEAIYLSNSDPYFERKINQKIQEYNNLTSRTQWVSNLKNDEMKWLNNYLYNAIKTQGSQLLIQLSYQPESLPIHVFKSLREKIFSLVNQNEFQAYELLAKAKNALSSKRYRDSDNGKKTRNFNLEISTIEKLAKLAKTTRLSQSELIDLIVERACEGDIDLEVRSAFLKRFSKSKPSSRSDS